MILCFCNTLVASLFYTIVYESKDKKHIEKIHQQAKNTVPFNPSNVAKRLAEIREYDLGLFFSNLNKLKGFSGKGLLAPTKG